MTRRFELDDLGRVVTVAETAIHPTGAFVVFTKVESSGGVRASSLSRVAPGTEPVALTGGPSDRAPRMTPDGESIVFLRDVDGLPQLHRLSFAGGEPVALTTSETLPGGAGPAAVDAAGIRLAFAAEVDRAPAVPGSPIVIDRLGEGADAVGRRGARRRHVFVLDLDTGRLRRLTDGDWDAGDPAWSPDGSRLAFTASTGSDTDEVLEGCVWTLAVDDPIPVPRRAGRARGVTGPVVWTADGSAVIAIGSAEPRVGNAHLLRLSVGAPEVADTETSDAGTSDAKTPDAGLAGADLTVADLADVDLTASLDRNVLPGAPAYPGGRPALTHDGTEIVFCARDRGLTRLYAVGVDGGECRALTSGRQVVSALSVAGSAACAAVVATTPESFGEVVLVDLAFGRGEPLTRLTADALRGVELLVPEEREFTISDGTAVHGWLLAAPETTGAAPLLLDIHGGPHNAFGGVADELRVYQQLLAASGWRVLTVNPRGSDGYGDEFFRAVDGAWGRADLNDLLEPVDRLVAEGLADPERLAVTGYSYGGFAVCALTAHTDRFAAAVAGGLLCDLVGLAAERTDGAFFSGIAAGRHPADEPDALLAASPLSRVGSVRTPTLVLHGDADEACPVQQAREWFAALRVRGVPTRMVVYPGADHLFVQNGPLVQRADYQERLVQWVRMFAEPVAGPSRAAASGSAAARGRAAAASVSPALPRNASYWRQRLDLLRERHGVVGAQFGLVRLDGRGEPVERVTVGSGLRDASRPDPVTADTVFQIGSITKAWTTVLVLQLVEEGKLTLDTPVREVLPGFALADPVAASAVTVRHLLTHTSGIEGDLITDTGPADDCVERYVESLRAARQLHPVGARFSYCNSGFVVAGRIVEVLRGTTWDEALGKHLLEPLGLRRTFTRLEDAPRFATANGHDGSGADAVPVTSWRLPRSMGPSGLVCATAADVLAFARMLLCAGLVPDGTGVLGEASAMAMRETGVDLHGLHPSATGWGLGLQLQDWGGAEVVGHDGATIGQRAFLRLLPGRGLAAVLLTSGGRADGLYRELFEDVAACAGVSMPPALGIGAERHPVPPGSYGFADAGAVVSASEGGGMLTVIQSVGATPEPVREQFELQPANVPDFWAWTSPELAGWAPFRPVASGAYLGLRYLPAAAPTPASGHREGPRADGILPPP